MTEAGALYGVGLGPGDPELVTVKAARLIGAAGAIAYFAKQGRESHARKIAQAYFRPGCEELLLAYPMTTERPFYQPEYVEALRRFYEESAVRLAVILSQGRSVALLCEGDPMFYGIGATLTRWVQPKEMHVIPAPSSYALAAARLAWPLQEVTTLSIHGRPLEILNAHLFPGARLLILSNDGGSPAAIARLLCARGFELSEVTALEHLGGPQEQRHDSRKEGMLRGYDKLMSHLKDQGLAYDEFVFSF